MKICILCLLVFYGSAVFTQNVKIKFDSIKVDKAALYSLEGETAHFIDSIGINNNELRFELTGKHPGFYRVLLANRNIDFLYDKENIELKVKQGNSQEDPEVISSHSNRIYYDFVNLTRNYKTKSELLQVILARYPKDDDYYTATMGKLEQIQEEYLTFVNKTSQQNPNSFIARYVRSAQLPAPDTGDPLTYLKSHALDMVNFYDDELIYSDAFTSKTIEYLSYYRNPQLPLELLEKEFTKAVDSILTKARVNGIVYKHITEYLLNGFKQYGFDNVLSYITENYVLKDDICLDVQLEKAMERRIQQARLFKAGFTVPDITLPDTSGAIVDLSKLNAEKILIVFYASWCPHCKKLLPELMQMYKEQNPKELEIAAVSLDSSAVDWKNFISSNRLSWINLFDIKGWDGKPAADYYIYATPTMFLVDRNLKLIGSPKDLEELRSMK